MAQEIYHRSEWGNPNEQWGNVYLNADLTNELYKRASEYENSWVTDQLLNGVGIKPSIILTPTAYEDGVLNSVKPAKTLGSELVTNGDFEYNVNGWSTDSGATLTWQSDQTCLVTTTADNTFAIVQGNVLTSNIKYKVSLRFKPNNTGTFRVRLGGSSVSFSTTSFNVNQWNYIEFEAVADNHIFEAGSQGGSITQFYIDNVSVKEVTEADFDFTRGSSATRVNELGLVQDVQLLSGELVQNGNFEQIGSELVTNGGFDTDSDWSLGTGATIENGLLNFNNVNNDNTRQLNLFPTPSLGTYVVSFDISNYVSGHIDLYLGGFQRFNFNADSNGTWTRTCVINNPSSNNIFYFIGDNFTGSIDNVSVKEVGQNWTVTNDDANNYVEFNQDEGTVRLKFLNTSPLTTLSSDTQYLSGNKYKLIVDVKEVVSGGIKIDAAGVSELFNSVGVQERIIEPTGNSFISFYRATANVDITLNSVSLIEITDDTDLPRINYTDGEGSLLLEPSRTNVLLHSNSLDQWATSTSIDVTSNQIGVGGSNDAWLINRTDTGARYVQASSTVSGTQVLSFYAKANTTDWIWVFNGTNSCYLDIANGVEGTSVGFSDIKFKLMDNSWYRISLKANNTTTYTRFYPSRTNGAVSGNTDLSFYLQYCGLEQGSYATSYIPTNGSTVTRLADVCNNSGNSDLINSTEGVLYAEISALANDGTNRTIALNKDSNDRIQMYFDTADNSLSIFYKAQGTHTFGMNETLTDATEFNKIAFKWKTNDFALWVNGIETDTVSSGVTSNADTLNALEFEMFNNFASFYGNVKCVAVFKQALSDTELQKLTTI